MGGDVRVILGPFDDYKISIHASVWEATIDCRLENFINDLISIHASVWEATKMLMVI